jgi:hypothetical protein
MMSDWQQFLKESDAEMRRNNLHRGVTYTPVAGELTIKVVQEYVEGFGYLGCGAKEVVTAVQRDERGVKRALATLVEDGVLTVKESATRGPKASKRKTYFPVVQTGPVTVSLPDYAEDYYLTTDENEHGAGGGRAIQGARGRAAEPAGSRVIDY